VADVRRLSHLLQKSMRVERRGEVGAQHLDRDRLVMGDHPPSVDGRSVPATDLALDDVPVGDGRFERAEVRGELRV
jgi:hypothetical protein